MLMATVDSPVATPNSATMQQCRYRKHVARGKIKRDKVEGEEQGEEQNPDL